MRKPPHVRLLYPQTAKPGTIKAAERAVKRFEQFGITTDSLPASKTAIKDVKSGSTLYRLAIATEPTDLDGFGFMQPSIGEMLSRSIPFLGTPPQIIGVGLSNAPLFEMSAGKEELTFGKALVGVGMILSLKKLKTLGAELQEVAIERTLLHLMGHVLLSPKHCENNSCIMRAHGTFDDIMETLVKPELDFCKSTAQALRKTVNQMQYAQ